MPCAQKARAMPKPMPLVEPVTIAVRLVFMMDLAADAPEPGLWSL
jgi:hypothetical protein